MRQLIIVRSVAPNETGSLGEIDLARLEALRRPLASHAGDNVFILASPTKGSMRTTLSLNETVRAQSTTFEDVLSPEISGYRGVIQLVKNYAHLAPTMIIVSEHGIRLAGYLAMELWRRSFELGPEIEPGTAVVVGPDGPLVRIP